MASPPRPLLVTVALGAMVALTDIATATASTRRAPVPSALMESPPVGDARAVAVPQPAAPPPAATAPTAEQVQSAMQEAVTDQVAAAVTPGTGAVEEIDHSLTEQVVEQLQVAEPAQAAASAPLAVEQRQEAAQSSVTVQRATEGQGIDHAATAQRVLQVQVGCVTRCRATSQVQEARQSAATAQGSVSGGSATTLQDVLQVQIGCLYVCRDTVQEQSATQDEKSERSAPAPRRSAQTGERPHAYTPSGALGEADFAELEKWLRLAFVTSQQTRQLQLGCRRECSQTVRHASVSRHASVPPAAPAPALEQLVGLLHGLIVGPLGASEATTRQGVHQVQVGCLRDCRDQVQVQVVTQFARTEQQLASPATKRRAGLTRSPGPALPRPGRHAGRR